jgi:hypothetical protein
MVIMDIIGTPCLCPLPCQKPRIESIEMHASDRIIMPMMRIKTKT